MADNRKFVQAQTFILAGSGSALGATSITLTSFAQIDGTLLTMTDFGTKGFCTMEPNNSTKEEAITFTGVTQNANGTATLTGVSSQLTVSPYTETSGTTKLHAGGTRLIVTNTAGFYDQFTNKEDDETISGLWTYAQFPQKSGSTTPTAANELASKAYVDSVVGGIAVTDQILTSGTAGEVVTAAGKIAYLLGTLWFVADSSNSSKSVGVKLGVFQAAAGGAGSSVLVLTAGIDKNQSALSGTLPYYLSTSGGISTTKGTNIRMVGRAQSATTLEFEDDEQSPEVLLTDGSRTYGVAGGTGGTYTLTLLPAPTAYKAGQTISFLAGTSSIAGTVTLNVNGLGAQIIKKVGNTSNLAAGDIKGTMIAVVQYDGTNFQLQNPVGNPPALFGTALVFGSVVNTTPQNITGTTFANVLAGSFAMVTSARRVMCSVNAIAQGGSGTPIIYADVAIDGSRLGGATYGLAANFISTNTNHGLSATAVSLPLTAASHVFSVQAMVDTGTSQLNQFQLYVTELNIP